MSTLQKKFSPLSTRQLLLRQLTADDADEIFLLRSDDEVNKYLGRNKAQTRDEALAFIQKINDGIEQHEWLYWAISLKEEPAALIGTVCLWNFSANGIAEIGYELMPSFQGKGIMQEAIAAVIEFAFRNINLKMLKAYTHVHNGRSSKLLEKFNFSIKTKPDEQDGSEDELKDMMIYTLTTPV